MLGFSTIIYRSIFYCVITTMRFEKLPTSDLTQVPRLSELTNLLNEL